ncbi:glycosyltransferase [Agaribacter marinus]|uniref:Glycosyl transferase n=1 Tax=Agaribacter marinus TaxID=1431249 RepID=A0AA37WHT2_9ALTE|nr:glycosyltransferase family 4 protein [Agaribacter marinus]GLR70172.1 glycosyl transferase [Agaribacter marinus]
MLQVMTHAKTAIFIGYVWPEPNTTAAGQNILSYMTTLVENNWHVHFWCAADKGVHAVDLEQHNVNVQQIKLNDDSFNQSLKTCMPSIVIFDRFLTEEQFAWRVAETCPDALRVLDCEDLHFLRHGREVLHKQSLKIRKKTLKATQPEQYQTSNDIFAEVSLSLLHTPQFHRELASIMRCDLVITLSSFERQVLQDKYGVAKDNTMHLPFIRPKPKGHSPTFEARQNIVTIGNLKHRPNVVAIEHLVERIMPPLRKHIPGIELHVYGDYAPPRILQLHNPKKGIFILGFVKDHIHVISHARLLVAPLHFGAGVKGKLLDAMTCMTPSVTTPIGAEGINIVHWPGAICTDDAMFVDKTIALYTDKSLWTEASEFTRSQDNVHFSISDNQRYLISRLTHALENRHLYRAKNFLQGIMMQQGMQASKYMSQWIVAKNKLKVLIEDEK